MANQVDANSDGIHTAMSDRRMGLYAGRLFGSIRSRRSTVQGVVGKSGERGSQNFYVNCS